MLMQFFYSVKVATLRQRTAKVKSSLARLPETSKHIHPMPVTSEDLRRSMSCCIQSKLELILVHSFFGSIVNNTSGHNKAYNLKTRLKTLRHQSIY